MKMLRAILLAAFLIQSQAYAADAPFTSAIKKPASRESSNSWPCSTSCIDDSVARAYLDREVISCLAVSESMQCQKFLDEHPALQPYKKDCSQSAICEEKNKNWASSEAFKACAAVAGPAAFHSFKAILTLPLSLTTAIYKTALFVGQSMHEGILEAQAWRDAYLDECRSSSEGKRLAAMILFENSDGTVIQTLSPNIGNKWESLSCEEILMRTTAYYESLQRTTLISRAMKRSYHPILDQNGGRPPPPELPGQSLACLSKEAQIAAGCYFLSEATTNAVSGWAVMSALSTIANKVPKISSTTKRPNSANQVQKQPLPEAPPSPESPPFKNVVHEKPAIQVGKPSSADHVTEAGYTYRTVGQEELNDAITSGILRPPPGGKSRGGRRNVKHWVRGGTGQFFSPTQPYIVIRVRNDVIKPDEFVKTTEIEVLNSAENWKVSPLLPK